MARTSVSAAPSTLDLARRRTMPLWELSQHFGEAEPGIQHSKEDVLSTVEFDASGQFLAVGDGGGRVVVFRSQGCEKSCRPPQFEFYTEFQSHHPDIDTLTSAAIDERINQIRWCPASSGVQLLLTTNDKTVKLWKLQERRVRRVSGLNLPRGAYGRRGSVKQLKVPKLKGSDSAICATPRRVYAHCHKYNIHSISPCSDGETFLSADELRINLWSYQHDKEAMNILDIAPKNIRDVTEVITSACFHPRDCSTLAYATSSAKINVCDTRARVRCEGHRKVLGGLKRGAGGASEALSSISDCKYSPGGRTVIARDYLGVKVWDVRMESEPITVIPVQDHLSHCLPELLDNEAIYDKFDVAVSSDGSMLATGSYDGQFNVLDSRGRGESSYKLPSTSKSRRASRRAALRGLRSIDFKNKAQHMAWHPSSTCLAVAGTADLYLYTSPTGPNSPIRSS